MKEDLEIFSWTSMGLDNLGHMHSNQRRGYQSSAASEADSSSKQNCERHYFHRENRKKYYFEVPSG
jgi:hypothetical protein